MSKTTVLAANLRRSSKEMKECVLFLLHALLRSSGCPLGVEAAISVVQFLLPGLAQRFLLALGINGTLLRSPDCGHTWRVLYPPAARAASEATAAAATTAPGTTTRRLADVLTPRAEEGRASGQDDESEKMTMVAALENVVFLASPRGKIAVSTDKGVTFSVFFISLSDASGGDAGDINRVAVLTPGVLLLASAHAVHRLDITQESGQLGLSGVALASGGTQVVLRTRQPVTMLKATWASSACRLLLVSEHNTLHISADLGETFLLVRHHLGVLRDAVVPASVRRSIRPPLDETSRTVRAVLASGGGDEADGAAAAGAAGGPAKGTADASGYEYAFGYTVDGGSAPDLARLVASLTPVTVEQPVSGGKQVCRYLDLLVAGVGSQVLQYDYTCMMRCAIVHPADTADAAGGAFGVFQIAQPPSFIPFTRSAPHEALTCEVAVSYGGKPRYVRGNSAGVSFSDDGTKWSTPKKAHPVCFFHSGILDIVSCSQRNVVTVFGASIRNTAIPSSLRIPALAAAVVF